MMKLTLLVVCAAVSICLASGPTPKPAQAAVPELRQEHREKRDKDGQVYAAIDTVYRGKERILDTVRYTRAHGAYAAGGGWRIYRVGGQPAMLEDEKTANGKVTVRLYGKSDDLEIFEVFERGTNGSVEAVSSEELAKLKVQAAAESAAAQAIVDRIQKTVETNTTVDAAMEDLRRQAEELKRSSKEKPDGQTK